MTAWAKNASEDELLPQILTKSAPPVWGAEEFELYLNGPVLSRGWLRSWRILVKL